MVFICVFEEVYFNQAWSRSLNPIQRHGRCWHPLREGARASERYED